MCRYKALKVGDKIRFVRLPTLDREQYEHTGDDFTVRVIQKLISEAVVCSIGRIDEYGYPWFDYEMVAEDGETEHHSLAVMDDESWELAE
jgi:hypothetical protein